MSRIIDRIPLFLSRLDIEKLVLKLWHTTEDREDSDFHIDLEMIIEAVRDKDFIELWMNNPDLRFGQAMVNLGYNIFDPLYHLEESEILVNWCGYSRPESYIWGSNYNEDGSIRKKPLYRFIDQLDDKHLATMVDEANAGTRYYNPTMVDIFIEELHRRGFINYSLTDEGRDKLRELSIQIERQRMHDIKLFLKNVISKQ
jgi:hypothetical protein